MKVTVFVSWEYEEIAGTKEEALQKLETEEMGLASFGDYVIDALNYHSLADYFLSGGQTMELIKSDFEAFKEKKFNDIWHKITIEVDSTSVESTLPDEYPPNPSISIARPPII